MPENRHETHPLRTASELARSYAIEVTGSNSKIEAIIDILRPIGIKEIVRTGTIAIARDRTYR